MRDEVRAALGQPTLTDTPALYVYDWEKAEAVGVAGVSADGRLAASFDRKGRLTLRQLPTLAVQREFQPNTMTRDPDLAHPLQVNLGASAFSADGRRLAVHEVRGTYTLPGTVIAMSFTAGLEHAAFVSDDRALLWQVGASRPRAGDR